MSPFRFVWDTENFIWETVLNMVYGARYIVKLCTRVAYNAFEIGFYLVSSVGKVIGLIGQGIAKGVNLVG